MVPNNLHQQRVVEQMEMDENSDEGTESTFDSPDWIRRRRHEYRCLGVSASDWGVRGLKLMLLFLIALIVYLGLRTSASGTAYPIERAANMSVGAGNSTD